MIKSSANKVTSFLYYNKYIDSDKYDYEVYLYGFEALIASILNSVAILLIGLLFDRFIDSIVFLACYCPLRQYSGGYHADTYKRCFFTFICIFLATIFLENNLGNIDLKPLIVLFSVLNLLSICMLSPVEHINNPLTYNEKIKYKRRARLIATLVFLFIVMSKEYFTYSAFALFWINIMMNIAVIKNRGGIR